MRPLVLGIVGLFAVSSIALSVAGCAVEPDGAGEPIASTSDAFSGLLYQDIAGTYPGATSLVQVSPGTQYFLSGVFGNFGGSGRVQASVWIGGTPSVQYAQLDADPAQGHWLRGTAWAIYPATNKPDVEHAFCQSSTSIGPQKVFLPKPTGYPAQWRCFLEQASSPSGANFNAWTDSAAISYDPSGTHAWLTCSGNAEARAACAPVTTYLGSVWRGSTAQALTTNLGPMLSGKTCLLTAINGKFRSNSTTNGVVASTNGTDWILNTGVDQGAGVDCVE